MKHPQWWADRLVHEVENGCNQKRAALLYAMLMFRVNTVQPDFDPWLRVNTVILARWSKGLTRVKNMAWKMEGQPIPGSILGLERKFARTSKVTL